MYSFHVNKQELVTNIIPSVLITLVAFGTFILCGKQLLTGYQTMQLNCGHADKIIKFAAIEQ